MAYTAEQLAQAAKERAALQVIIANRQEQEKAWQAKHEKVFVPTDNKFSNVTGLNLLDYAVKLGDFETVKALVDEGVTSKFAVLYALDGGYSEIAEFLLAKGVEYDLLMVMRIKDSKCKEVMARFAKTQFDKDFSKIAARDDAYYVAKKVYPKASESKASLLHHGALMPFSEFRALSEKIPEDKIDWEAGVNDFDGEMIAEKGIRPIGYAIGAGNLGFLDYLFKMGAQVEQELDISSKYTPMQLALRLGNVEIATVLKGKGASLEGIDRMGGSTLHVAIQSGNPKAVEFVLNHGKNLRLVANYGRNPIHYLATCKNEEIIRMILNHPLTKPLVNEKDYFGFTPADLAKMEGNNVLLNQLSLHDPDAKKEKPVDIRQKNVLDKLTYFLKLTNIGDPASMPEGGHCNGFAFLFLYYRRRGLRDEFFKMLKLISAWDGNPDFLKKTEPVAAFSGNYKNVTDLFNQWVNDLIWFQQSNLNVELKGLNINPTQSARKQQYDIVKKSKSIFELPPRFLTRGENLSAEQLGEYLDIFKEMPSLDVEFSKGEHATSLAIMSDGRFDYYDPNQSDILEPFASSSFLASHIKDTKYRLLNRLFPDQSMSLEIRYHPAKNYSAFPGRTESWHKDSYNEYYKKSPNQFTPLHVAIIANDEAEVERLLKTQDLDLSLKNKLDKNALEMAVSLNAENMVRLFCKHHPTFVSKNPDILPMTSKENRALLYYLLDNFQFTHSAGLLNQAVIDKDRALIGKLLRNGFSPDEESEASLLFHRIPIINAVDMEELEIVKALMRSGASLPAESIFFSKLARNPEITKFLIDNYQDKMTQLILKDSSDASVGYSFVDFMIFEGQYAKDEQVAILNHLAQKNLIDKNKLNNECALHKLIDLNSTAAFDFLIDFGCDLNQLNGEGKTPILTALGSDWNPKSNFAKKLIEAGADVTIADKEKNALPIHYALAYCVEDLALIRKLIDAGSPLNHQTKRGMTPLHLAVSKGNLAAVELLLRAGADCTIKGPDEKSAIDLAKEKNPEIHALICQYQTEAKSQKPVRITTRFETIKHTTTPIARKRSENQEGAPMPEERKPSK